FAAASPLDPTFTLSALACDGFRRRSTFKLARALCGARCAHRSLLQRRFVVARLAEPIDPLAFNLKKFQRAAGEIAAIGDAQVHRIDLLAAPQHLVVKVRAGRTPGGADIADDLALAHLNARAHAACETR